MQTCAGVPGPQGSSEGTSGLVTQRSCRCLVPAESQGCLLRDGPSASVCSPPDQYHCRWVISPGSEMPPCIRPGRAALTASLACPYLHAVPQPGEPTTLGLQVRRGLKSTLSICYLGQSESLCGVPPGVFQLLLLPPRGPRSLLGPQAALPALPWEIHT